MEGWGAFLTGNPLPELQGPILPPFQTTKGLPQLPSTLRFGLVVWRLRMKEGFPMYLLQAPKTQILHHRLKHEICLEETTMIFRSRPQEGPQSSGSMTCGDDPYRPSHMASFKGIPRFISSSSSEFKWPKSIHSDLRL